MGCKANVGAVENLLHSFELIPNSSAVQTIAYSIHRLRHSSFQLDYYKNYEHTILCYKVLHLYFTLKSEVQHIYAQ
jgi:hypothetical protein